MFGLGIACAGAAGVALAMVFHSRPTLRCSGSPGIPWRNRRWTGQGREPIGGGTCRRSDPDRLHGAASVRLRLPGSLPLACCNIPGGIMGWLARWRRWRNLAELQGIISLPKMPISVMPNRTLTSPSHIRSSFSRFAQHLSADQQPFAPTIWPDCRLRLRCGRGGYSAEIAKINVLGIPAP
jgi:hypothetical protein